MRGSKLNLISRTSYSTWNSYIKIYHDCYSLVHKMTFSIGVGEVLYITCSSFIFSFFYFNLNTLARVNLRKATYPLQEARTKYRTIVSGASSQMETIARDQKRCIQKSREYYKTVAEAKVVRKHFILFFLVVFREISSN